MTKSKPHAPDLTPSETSPEAPKRTKIYTFPDIATGGTAVTIEATSLEEATRKYFEQKGSA